MKVEAIAASDADFVVVEKLSRYYNYDMSEYTGWPCPEQSEYGGCDEFFAEGSTE